MSTFTPRRRFVLEGKGISATSLRSGDLEISGYALTWNTLDADGETFIRGALRDAIPAFIESGGVLAWQHRPADHPLGRVLEMEEDDVGVRFKARVDHQPASSPLRFLYDAIKRGTMRGCSIGGYFGDRRPTVFGDLIERVVRITELSLTTHPKDPNPGVRNVVEVKAMMGEPVARPDWTALRDDVRVLALKTAIYRAEYDVAALAKSLR